MNTYSKFAPNVFLAKCTEAHDRGELITLTTQYGKEHECIVFNMIAEKDGYFYYSIVRSDGFNVQEHAKRRAERLIKASENAESKSAAYWQASNEGRDFLALGEPIKVGHHSEHRHRALIQRNHDRMSKAVDFSKKAEELANRAEYWKARESTINLSMPESLDYYQYKLEQAKERHEGLKNGSIKREHSFSLTYANKEVKELEKKVKLAEKLWKD
jgi:hypothetical protein